MKKAIPRNVKHAFLISSYMGSVLKYNKEGTPQLNALHRRINQGMQRFAIIGGSRAYNELSNEGARIWKELSEVHHTLLKGNETEIFVEMLGSLMSPKNHKDFLGMDHFKTKERVDDDKYAAMCYSVLDLNDKVNELLGTKSQAYPLLKPKVKKEKKKREKSTKKKDTKVSRTKLKEAERRAKSRSFLRDRIAKAKSNKEDEV